MLGRFLAGSQKTMRLFSPEGVGSIAIQKAPSYETGAFLVAKKKKEEKWEKRGLVG